MDALSGQAVAALARPGEARRAGSLNLPPAGFLRLDVVPGAETPARLAPRLQSASSRHHAVAAPGGQKAIRCPKRRCRIAVRLGAVTGAGQD